MKKIILYFLSLIVLMSCCNNKRESEPCNIDSVIFNLDDCLSSDKIDTFEYDLMPLENNPQGMLSGIDKMIVTSKGLYILDTRYIPSLFLFGHDGRFINKIGVQGRSKSEYIRIDNFTANEEGDTVAIMDDFGKVIKLYTFNGTFLNSYTLEDEYGWDDLLLLENNFYLSSYHHGYNGILTKFDTKFSQKTTIGLFDPELISGGGCFRKYTQFSSKYICFLDYYNSCFYLFDRKNTENIIKLTLNSSNILSPSKKDYNLQPYDKILEYALSDDYIFMLLECDGCLRRYRIDINNKSMWQERKSGVFHSFLDYYKGEYYEYFSANQIKELSQFCKNDTNLMKVIAPYLDSLSVDDNYYILKVKLANETHK